MPGYVCADCHLVWAPAMNLARCAECRALGKGGKLRYSQTKEAMSWEECRRRQTNAAFSEYYERREGDRVGSSPEQQGIEAAQRSIALIRLLEEAWNLEDAA